MWHSIKEISERYESISRMRGDKKLFLASDFLAFAMAYQKKYQLIEENGVLMVNTWNSNDLIDDYRKQL